MLLATIDPTRIDLSKLSRAKKERAIVLLRERAKRMGQRLFYSLYPEQDSIWEGPTILKGLMRHGQTLYSRDKYPKHMEFFEAGAKYRERGAICANRVGKTFGMGGYEMAAHLTGEYPTWWKGRRFSHPISAWAVGKKNETTRDIVQRILLGKVTYSGQRKTLDGCGVIPGARLGEPTWKQGVQNFVDTILVKNVTGGWSQLGFKSYEQGRGAFEGDGQHVIWMDEEPSLDIYIECLTRTATTNGIQMMTVTPLEGYSEVIMSFHDPNAAPGGG